MPGLGARLFVYGFFGLFGLVGALFLCIALSSAIHRAIFLHTALRAEGTVIEMRPTNTTRTGAGQRIPIFRYTASDGHAYIIVSGVPAQPSSYSVGQQVPILYQQGHPESAVLDAFTLLWLYSLVFGIVGAAFFSIPVFLVVINLRQRRSASVLTS